MIIKVKYPLLILSRYRIQKRLMSTFRISYFMSFYPSKHLKTGNTDIEIQLINHEP